MKGRKCGRETENEGGTQGEYKVCKLLENTVVGLWLDLSLLVCGCVLVVSIHLNLCKVVLIRGIEP